MLNKIAALGRSFGYALCGIGHCIRRERNFRIHLVAAAYVLALAAYLHITGVRLALLILTIGGVLALELVNTAAEALVDLVSPQRRPLAKIAKDTAAGAVLVFAASAAGVGAVLLWQPRALMTLLLDTLASPARFLALAASALVAGWFVFGFSRGDCNKENL